MIVAGFAFVSALWADTVSYTYDSNGQIEKADYGAGNVITYTYDAAGNIVGVSATGTSASQFYFPFYQGGTTGFTGFAVSNYSDMPASLEFSAYGTSGNPLAFSQNPASFLLPPRQQLARAGSEIFSVDPSTPQAGWVRMESDNAQIASFFQFGANDLTQLDGSLALDRQGKKLYFTRVFEGATAFRGQPATTFLSLANPNDQTLTVKLNLYGPQPAVTLAPEQVRTIPAQGTLYQSVSQIFGQGLSAGSGYITVEVAQGDGAVGFELIRLTAQSSVIGLNASFGDSASKSYSAQLASETGTIFTSLKLINTSSQRRTVSLRAIGESGSDMVAPVNRILEPGQILEQDASEIFAFPISTASVGSLRVEADGEGVIGDVIFGNPVTAQYAAALPLQTQPFTRAVFSQVVNLPPLFTGLALYNPGEAAAHVIVEVFSAQGTRIDQASVTVGAGERVSKFVSQFAPSTAGQAGGYVSIRSTQPLIAQQLFGNYGLTFLSAVPPAIVATGPVADSVPNITVTPESLDFGSVAPGQSKDLAFTVGNTGSAALTVHSISSSNARFSVTSPATPFTVAAGGQQTGAVRFAPTGPGAQSATLALASNDPRGAVTVRLSGTGAGVAAGPPVIGDVTVTKLGNDSVKIDVQLTDPDGDVVKIEYIFFRSGAQGSTRVVNSPADINLAGFTSGTVSQTFTGIGVATPFGTVLPDRVDIEATDAGGLKSNKVSKVF